MNALALLPLLASAAVATDPAPPRPPLVRVVATNYAFQAPETSPGGLVTVRLVNRGQEPHYARLLRLAPGKTLADFAALRRQGRGAADWLVPTGGIAPVSPGDSADLTLTLAPGRYLVICGYPGREGRPHVDMGMMREIVIAAAPRARPVQPREDVRLRVTDGTLAWSEPLAAGRHVVQVENDGTQMHQLLLARLPEGTTLEAEKRWFDDFRGERPGRPAGGVIELRRGERVWLALDLPPGRYALLCHVTGPDGRNHFLAGEAVEFTIPRAESPRVARTARPGRARRFAY
ncbi:MAG TPA: hypothetical protein VF092_02430 [Longimicrobium sp.]